ncbi:MAG TPA: DUF1849 family protein [Aestuariivirga sp.]
MIHTKTITIFTLLLCLPQPAFAMDLASYRADYDLQPVRIEQGGKVQPIDGQLAYEVAGSDCAGWTVSTQIKNRIAQAEQGLQTTDIKSRSFETDDGLSMTVSQQESIDGKLSDDSEIKVAKPEIGAPSKGNLNGSKSLNFSLNPEVIYPTEHQRRLLAAAAKGLTRDVSTVYDGSDGEKVFRIVTFISKKHEATAQPRGDLSALDSLASWTFQLGYYPVTDEQADTPEFQTTFNMFENGVSTAMVFDYGNYAMKATISKLEMLPATPCPVSPVKLQ